MAFWDRFRRNREEEYEEFEYGDSLEDEDEESGSEWASVVYNRQNLDVHDSVSRREYVQNCLIQMSEGGSELDGLQFEYRQVTEYLQDMEILDEMEPEQREPINLAAMKIQEHEDTKKRYLSRKSKMSDREYERMERLGDKRIRESLQKMLDGEIYQKKIRNDLKRLDGERKSNRFREEQVQNTLETARSLSIFVAVALVVILIILFALQMLLEFNVTYGYMIAILASAIASVALYVQITNSEKERRSIRKAQGRLIQLQNTVKIRYVNNRNLLDYLYLQCGVQSADELSAKQELFREERIRREEFRAAEKNLDSDQKDLVFLLREANLRYPEIWIHQTPALLSHNEEVEIRHGLIVQRQSLRKRIEYNTDVVVGNAKREIKDLADSYPRYAAEILEQVSKFQAESGLD